MNKFLRTYRWIVPVMGLFLLGFSLGAYSGEGGKNGGRKTLEKPTAGETFLFDVNNLYVPINNKGVIADVTITGNSNTPGGKYDNKVVIFSAGFFLSGLDNGNMFANGVLSASRIQDYQAGNVGTSAAAAKNKIYVVKANDAAFGLTWKEWKDAVSQGADYYDGDGNGVYDPIDRNGSGAWDRDEDRPDIIGDVTAWCVYNDGVAKATRRFTNIDPKGIEIHQTVFAFNSKGVVGNMLFVRYRLVNTGSVNNQFDSVYFAVAADPDLGDYQDDLVGCDTTLSAGFVYQTTPDATFGANAPTCLMDFFQGPVEYIPGVTFTDVNNNKVYDQGVDIAKDTAHNVRGKVLGVKSYPGARNQPLSSFTQYMQSHPTHGDPNTADELRYYMLGGKGKDGSPLNVCTWTFGNGSTLANCAQVNPKYMYSGNPVPPASGWLNTNAQDQRLMCNTGPFTLKKGFPVDIVAAYVIGRSGQNSVQSVKVAKDYDQVAQLVFDNNFPSPPPPPPVQAVAKTGKDFIDITWNTASQVKYRAIDSVLAIDRRVKGYYITAYRTNSKNLTIAGETNAAEVANYSIMTDSIRSLYQKLGDGAIILRREVAPVENWLDSSLYASTDAGRIRFRVSQDPFNPDNPLVKGKEYYFAITMYTLNHQAIVNNATGKYGDAGDYIDNTASAYEEYETSIIRVVFGQDQYNPSVNGATGSKTAGASSGAVRYLVVEPSKMTGDTYTVEFFKDTKAASYQAYWRLKNNRTGAVLVDSSKNYNFDSTIFAGKVTDGFVAKVKGTTTTVQGVTAQTYSKTPWYKELAVAEMTGAYYVGKDITQGVSLAIAPNVQSNVIAAEKLRTVEIRFGQPSKAYRYLNGFKGTAVTRRGTFIYAEGITASDTAGRGGLGKFGQGFVDVPYSAWVVDKKYGEERQLATGFIEKSTPLGGSPDGIWNPKDSILKTGELIVVFDAAYDAAGNQKVYKGYDNAGTLVPADIIKGYDYTSANGASATDSATAKSPYFNAMWVAGFSSKTADVPTFTTVDTFRVSITEYPYTDKDKYTFTTSAGSGLSNSDKKDLFEKINVFPNPLFAYNPASSYNDSKPDDPFVTFNNLPEMVSIKIYTLSGTLIRTLTEADKRDGVSSPFLQWNLLNQSGLRVASGVYLAVVSVPGFGERVLKIAVIMPQKQLQYY